MNKTVNINLAGMVFHIDEEAYLKLENYFDAIKRYLSKSEGHEEIIKDIEHRISELLSEKCHNNKNVVVLKDIEEVINVMGKPEDYIIDGEENQTQQTFTENKENKPLKKLYRDSEKGMISGVAMGLSHYFGIDVTWIRLLLLLSFFGFGSGILAYIILWIAIPEATTTAEKIEMMGESVNISNIEKKIRSEIKDFADKINYKDLKPLQQSTQKIGGFLEQFFILVLNFIRKISGFFFIFIGILMVLFSFFIGTLSVESFKFIDFSMVHNFESTFINFPIPLLLIAMAFVIGIPFFLLTLLGFKLIKPKNTSLSNNVLYALGAVWILAISVFAVAGIKQGVAFSNEGRVVFKENLSLFSKDTLQIKFKYNPDYTRDEWDYKKIRMVQDSLNNNIIFSNNVRLKIAETTDLTPYIQIQKQANGSSMLEAKEKAKAIKYNYLVQNNQILFDNYLTTDAKNKFLRQRIEITLFLPKNTVFKTDSSSDSHTDFQYENDGNMNEVNFSNPVYKVDEGKIIRLK